MKKHKVLIPLYDKGVAAFVIVAAVFIIIIVNIGFSVSDTQKQAVEHAYDEVRDQLEISGRISAAADISSGKITVTAIPVRVSTGGTVNMNPQSAQISYNSVLGRNTIDNYENIYADRLSDKTFNSLRNAVSEAKIKGIIDTNPFVDEQKPTSTTAFVYWVINHNFDHFIDDGELAVIAIVYAGMDRPSSGDNLFIEVNVPEGFVLRIEQEVPDISNEVLNFGGILNDS